MPNKPVCCSGQKVNQKLRPAEETGSLLEHNSAHPKGSELVDSRKEQEPDIVVCLCDSSYVED